MPAPHALDLEIIHPDGTRQVHRLAGPVVSIGRSNEGNLIVLKHDDVSRRHAVVEFKGGGVFVKDVSTNGTFVDGKRINSEAQLPLGRQIKVGPFLLRFRAPGTGPQAVVSGEAAVPSRAARQSSDMPAGPTVVAEGAVEIEGEPLTDRSSTKPPTVRKGPPPQQRSVAAAGPRQPQASAPPRPAPSPAQRPPVQAAPRPSPPRSQPEAAPRAPAQPSRTQSVTPARVSAPPAPSMAKAPPVNRRPVEATTEPVREDAQARLVRQTIQARPAASPFAPRALRGDTDPRNTVVPGDDDDDQPDDDSIDEQPLEEVAAVAPPQARPRAATTPGVAAADVEMLQRSNANANANVNDDAERDRLKGWLRGLFLEALDLPSLRPEQLQDKALAPRVHQLLDRAARRARARAAARPRSRPACARSWPTRRSASARSRAARRRGDHRDHGHRSDAPSTSSARVASSSPAPRFTRTTRCARRSSASSRRSGRRIDESSPLVDARLKDGSRVNAIIRPLALRGSCITIRKFAKTPLDARQPHRLRQRSTERMARFLDALRASRKKNIVISGGTGSGKTTLLNVLSGAIPPTSASSPSRTPPSCSCSSRTSSRSRRARPTWRARASTPSATS